VVLNTLKMTPPRVSYGGGQWVSSHGTWSHRGGTPEEHGLTEKNTGTTLAHTTPHQNISSPSRHHTEHSLVNHQGFHL